MITFIDHFYNIDDVNVLLTASTARYNDQKASQVSRIGYWIRPLEET